MRQYLCYYLLLHEIQFSGVVTEIIRGLSQGCTDPSQSGFCHCHRNGCGISFNNIFCTFKQLPPRPPQEWKIMFAIFLNIFFPGTFFKKHVAPYEFFYRTELLIKSICFTFLRTTLPLLCAQQASFQRLPLFSCLKTCCALLLHF